MLQLQGRLNMPPLKRWRHSLLDAGLLKIPISGEIGIKACELQDFHADPADRLIDRCNHAGAWRNTADR